MTRAAAALVAGATGALRPAVRQLAVEGRPVFALARPGPRLAALQAEFTAVRPVAVDWHDVRALRAALHAALGTVPPGGIDALLYCPGAPAAAVSAFTAVADRAVLLLTSAAADPVSVGDAAPDPARLPVPGGAVPVLLGWAVGTDGRSRWHTPDEISAAARAASRDGTPRTLGVVRPWADRPSH